MRHALPLAGMVCHDDYQIEYQHHAATAPDGEHRHAFYKVGADALSEGSLAYLFEDTALWFAQDPLMHHSGTTATVAQVTAQGKLHLAYVGDSQLFLHFRKKHAPGEAIALIDPHVPTAAAELARIERAGGVVIDGHLDNDLPLSRAFGNRALPGITYKPDCRTVDLKPYFSFGEEFAIAVVTGDRHAALSLTLQTPPKEAITLALFAGHGCHGAHAARNVSRYMFEQIGHGAESAATARAAQASRFERLRTFARRYDFA